MSAGAPAAVGTPYPPETEPAVEPKLPPIAELALVAMVLVIPAVIYLAANVADTPSLAPAIGLLAASGALTLVNLALLARVREFAWRTFKVVGGYTLLGYTIIAGMIEYVFVLDGTRGGTLAVLTASLALFAVNVPLLLAFFVAKYQPAPPRGA